MKRLGMALILCGLLAGCGSSGSPRIDATSDESIRVSLAQMGDGLTMEQKQEFMSSLSVLTLAPAVRETMRATLTRGPVREATSSSMFKPVDGLTREEIIRKAAAVRAQAVAASNPSRP